MPDPDTLAARPEPTVRQFQRHAVDQQPGLAGESGQRVKGRCFWKPPVAQTATIGTTARRGNDGCLCRFQGSLQP